jgi:DNA invertase Pin-like site-specific DNA recombinase
MWDWSWVWRSLAWHVTEVDWHHLLEICALTHTLILDEEGLYDPSTFNDRLLLGLKGTMSEAELFVLRARLQGGILNKARRGALKLALPIGLCYTESDTIVLDPKGPRASHHSRGLSQF